MIHTDMPSMAFFCALADDRPGNLAKMCNEQKCFLIHILATEAFILFLGHVNEGCISQEQRVVISDRSDTSVEGQIWKENIM